MCLKFGIMRLMKPGRLIVATQIQQTELLLQKLNEKIFSCLLGCGLVLAVALIRLQRLQYFVSIDYNCNILNSCGYDL
jgi:hypothetical protein